MDFYTKLWLTAVRPFALNSVSKNFHSDRGILLIKKKKTLI